MSIEKGWIGANTEKQARELLSKKFPDGEILNIYEKIAGMFSYEVKLTGKKPVIKQEEPSPDDEVEEENDLKELDLKTEEVGAENAGADDE